MTTDQWGETPSFYIWPKDHEEGSPYPDDFHADLRKVLRAAGFDCESV